MHGKQDERIIIPTEERHRSCEQTELDFQSWSIRLQVVFSREVGSISRQVLVPTSVPHKALTHTHTHTRTIISYEYLVQMVRIFRQYERDKQLYKWQPEFAWTWKGRARVLRLVALVSLMPQSLTLQCYQGHEGHQHQFGSCTEKGDSDCTKKQEGNWIAQHHRWHSGNLSVLLGYRQWKSGMCESYDWRFVDHPSWSKHGHRIAPKWGRMKNPSLGKKIKPPITHFALL